MARKWLKGFNPASFFTIIWAGQILVMLIGWYDYLLFKYLGLFYILFAITCYDLGYLIISPQLRHKDSGSVTIGYKRQQCRMAYFFVLIMAFVGILYNMYRNGFGLSSFLSLESFMEMSNDNSVNRYTGGAAERNILTNIFDVNGYACPLLGGLFYHYYEGKKRLWAYMGLLPSVIDGLVQGAKMGIITGVFMWVIGYIISSDLLAKKIKFKLRHIIIITVSVFCFFLLLFVTMMFRYGELDEETAYIVTGKISSYSLGHLPAFDQWYYNHQEDITEYTLGGRTFNGITNPLGILKRGGGVFDEPIDTSKYGDSTNVYTVFRFIAEDFGTMGSFVYFFIIGIVSRIIYYNFRERRSISISVSLLSMIYFFISWSFVSSIYAYTTYVALTFYLYFVIFLFWGKISRPLSKSVVVHE